MLFLLFFLPLLDVNVDEAVHGPRDGSPRVLVRVSERAVFLVTDLLDYGLHLRFLSGRPGQVTLIIRGLLGKLWLVLLGEVRVVIVGQRHLYVAMGRHLIILGVKTVGLSRITWRP